MTAPRTWVAAELVTASIMNTHVRDMLNAVAASKGLLLGGGDPNGIALTTGVRGYFVVPMSVRVTGWDLIADVAGSIVLDVWRKAFASGLPAGADTITGTEKPTLTALQKAQDTSLSTWVTDLNAGDILAVNVDSVSGGIKAFNLTLRASLLALL